MSYNNIEEQNRSYRRHNLSNNIFDHNVRQSSQRQININYNTQDNNYIQLNKLNKKSSKLFNNQEYHQQDQCIIQQDKNDFTSHKYFNNNGISNSHNQQRQVRYQNQIDSFQQNYNRNDNFQRIQNRTDNSQRIQNQIGTVQHIQSQSDTIQHVQNQTDNSQHVQNQSNNVKQHQNQTDNTQHVQNKIDTVEQHQNRNNNFQQIQNWSHNVQHRQNQNGNDQKLKSLNNKSQQQQNISNSFQQHQNQNDNCQQYKNKTDNFRRNQSQNKNFQRHPNLSNNVGQLQNQNDNSQQHKNRTDNSQQKQNLSDSVQPKQNRNENFQRHQSQNDNGQHYKNRNDNFQRIHNRSYSTDVYQNQSNNDSSQQKQKVVNKKNKENVCIVNLETQTNQLDLENGANSAQLNEQQPIDIIFKSQNNKFSFRPLPISKDDGQSHDQKNQDFGQKHINETFNNNFSQLQNKHKSGNQNIDRQHTSNLNRKSYKNTKSQQQQVCLNVSETMSLKDICENYINQQEYITSNKDITCIFNNSNYKYEYGEPHFQLNLSHSKTSSFDSSANNNFTNLKEYIPTTLCEKQTLTQSNKNINQYSDNIQTSNLNYVISNQNINILPQHFTSSQKSFESIDIFDIQKERENENCDSKSTNTLNSSEEYYCIDELHDNICKRNLSDLLEKSTNFHRYSTPNSKRIKTHIYCFPPTRNNLYNNTNDMTSTIQDVGLKQKIKNF